MAYSPTDVQALMNEVDHNAAQIAALQARNAEIRTSLALEAMGTAWQDAHGVQNLVVAGVKLKFECKQNYTVNGKELAKIYNSLSEEDKAAIKYKPEVSLTGLKAASPQGRALLNTVITSKPGLPTVSYGK
jgi:hypothetical protein